MIVSRSGLSTLPGILVLALVWLVRASPLAAQSPDPSPAATPQAPPEPPFPVRPSSAASPAAATPAASPAAATPGATVPEHPASAEAGVVEPDVIKGDDDGDSDDVAVRVRPEVLEGHEPGSTASGAPDPAVSRGAAPVTALQRDEAADPAPKSIPRASGAPRPAENYIRDDAQVFPAAVTAALTRTIQSLEGKADIFIVTKVIEDMALFDQASQAAFKEIVDEVNHYRVVVVFIAYNSDRDRGIVSTNLGYGVWHILTKKDCENLFGKDDAALTVEGIKSGVERLVSTISEYHKGHPDSPAAPAFTGFENLGRNLPRVLVVAALFCGVVWFWRRGSNCPKCGAALKTRVSISMATRTGRMAKKTYKCFRCGYTRRQSLLPTGGYGDAPGRMPAGDEETVEAGADDEVEEAVPGENTHPAA